MSTRVRQYEDNELRPAGRAIVVAPLDLAEGDVVQITGCSWPDGVIWPVAMA